MNVAELVGTGAAIVAVRPLVEDVFLPMIVLEALLTEAVMTGDVPSLAHLLVNGKGKVHLDQEVLLVDFAQGVLVQVD
jgi:hypothetical protein